MLKTQQDSLNCTILSVDSSKPPIYMHIRSVQPPSCNSMVLQEVLEIQVKPGWKEGTRITFTGKGDELPGRPAQVTWP